MLSLSLLLISLFTETYAYLAVPRLSPRQHFLPVEQGSAPTNNALFIEMPIDHFSNETTATFKNRYWVNATYYVPGGPVFLFDSGEQNAEPLLPYYLQEYHGLSATMQFAKRFGGVAVLWEHRYYGASLPFPVNHNTTADEWQYLTTEQALEDVVYFANHFTLNTSDDGASTGGAPFHPSRTPWIWLGASYPGVRGALMRVRNPEVIYAVWASSAPVQAQIDMASYYEAAERSLTGNCSADWVAVTRYVDTTLANGTADVQNEMKARLLSARASSPTQNISVSIQKAAAASNVDAAGVLMDPLNFYQYYGFAASVLPFCDVLETRNETMGSFEGGLISAMPVEDVFEAFLTAIEQVDYDDITGSPDDPVTDLSWMRQYCSEYGFYQRGDPSNPLSIETSFESLELFQAQCNETFPDLNGPPAVDHILKYGGWNMNPSNVLFTNGEFDPWRTMGLASIEPNSPTRIPSPAIPPCNVPPANSSSFFGITHPDMVHASDLRVLLEPDENHTDFKTVGFYSPISQVPFYTGVGLFGLALQAWLPCFNTSEDIVL
ncbi:peptidase S28 [Peniophora sp. CONT]|nr:peptidase S28 [Peniophora sp. CONT]